MVVVVVISVDCGGGVMMGVARLSGWFYVLMPRPDKI